MILNYKNIIFLFFCLICFNSTFYAQLYDVFKYDDSNGLPSRIVNDVIQDQKGFLWVAGNNGLYKFDGKTFKSFYAVLKDSTGLRGSRITAITESKNGTLWIGTPKGLHFLRNDKISYYSLKDKPNEEENFIKKLVEDSHGNLWVGTYGGLFVLDQNKAESMFLSHPEIGKIPEKNIDGISKHKNKSVWVTAENNLYYNAFDKPYGFKKIKLTFSDALKNSKIKLYNIIDFNEQLMLVESNIGLLKGCFLNPSEIHLSWFYNENNKPIAQQHIYRVIVDYENNIWTATWKNRFKKYKFLNEYLIEQKVVSTTGDMLDMSDNAKSIYEDAQHNIWIPNTNGLYKLTASKNPILTFPPSYLPDCVFKRLSIYAVTEDRGNNIWLTTPYELYRFNKKDILNGKCPTDYIHIKNEHLQLSRNLFIDSKNRLWVGGQGGLSVTQLDANFNPSKFKHFTMADGLPHNWSFDILETNPDNFWIGNYAGLVKLNLPNGKINSAQFTFYESNSAQKNTLVNSYTTDLEEDKNQHLWVGTFHGLSKVISSNKTISFTNYNSKNGDYQTLSNDAIKQVFKDKSNRLWIGTQTGLNLYNYNNDTFLQLGRQEGLPSEYILGLSEDSKGYLWVATTNGVIRAFFNSKKQTFTDITHFTRNEGLADNITYRNALYIDKNDNAFIGSRDGLSIITNKEQKQEFIDYNLAITSFKSTKKNTTGFVPIEKQPNSKNIKLNHFENSIKINYAVLDFTNPKNNRYRHKILPVSNQWIETKNSSELVFYNLKPDAYELILDGTNNQNRWSKNPISIKFVIVPPFWKSNIALTIYALLLLATLQFLYKINNSKRIYKLEQQTNLERSLVKQREKLRQENTADFHDELGSKVTKISLFLTLAQRSISEKKDPSKWLDKIRANTKDLSGGFRDLLWVIDPKKDSLNDTFLRLKDYGEDVFNNGEKQFRTHDHSINSANLILDPQTKKQVVMIFKEAMNNCVKHSNCNQVELISKSDEHFSSLELKDNGTGFNVEKKSKGRGLKNMITRSLKIKANLIITSNKKGTSIYLNRIPHMSDDLKQNET